MYLLKHESQPNTVTIKPKIQQINDMVNKTGNKILKIYNKYQFYSKNNILNGKAVSKSNKFNLTQISNSKLL